MINWRKRIKRNAELFNKRTEWWEEEEWNYRNWIREDERKRMEAFEEEVKCTKKLINKQKRMMKHDTMKFAMEVNVKHLTLLRNNI